MCKFSFLLKKHSSRRRPYTVNKVQDVVCEWCPAKVLSLKKLIWSLKGDTCRFIFRFSLSHSSLIELIDVTLADQDAFSKVFDMFADV